MSSMIIPKEQQTAYERWELSSLKEHNQRILPIREKKSSELSDTLAQITDAARKEGYQQGLREGYEEGSQQARLDFGVNQQALGNIAEAMQKMVNADQQQITQELLKLALDIAKSMVKSRIEVNVDVIIPIVEEAIQSLPYIQKPAKILVNPIDAAILKQELAEALSGTWTIVENNDIERGGCLIETGTNQVDATNATRWKRINEALGQNTDWMAHE